MDKRGTLNFWIDVLLAVLMAGLTWTGALIYFVMPPGSGHSRTLFGLSRHDFGDWHFYMSIAAVMLVILHLVLHWDWVACMVCRHCGRDKPTPGTRRVMGVVLLALVVVGFFGSLWLASTRLQAVPGGGGHGHGRGSSCEFDHGSGRESGCGPGIVCPSQESH
ncbi:MAG: DUF4405 domain-containing protein [Candidatus Xenobium sp.]|jgi:hypothetical protein|nr:DUF4405 domain-containing protein [Burkholderiales bacterium]